MIKSFIATVEVRDKGLLLGGVKRNVSSRFESFQDAVHWSDEVIRANLEAGRDPVFGGIRASTLIPEVPHE